MSLQYRYRSKYQTCDFPKWELSPQGLVRKMSKFRATVQGTTIIWLNKSTNQIYLIIS